MSAPTKTLSASELFTGFASDHGVHFFNCGNSFTRPGDCRCEKITTCNTLYETAAADYKRFRFPGIKFNFLTEVRKVQLGEEKKEALYETFLEIVEAVAYYFRNQLCVKEITQNDLDVITDYFLKLKLSA